MIKRYHSGKQSQPPGRVLYGTKDKGVTLKVDKIIPNEMVEKENVPVQGLMFLPPPTALINLKSLQRRRFVIEDGLIIYTGQCLHLYVGAKDPAFALAVARLPAPPTICGPARTAA
jgi:hypothetical protein